MSVAERSNVIRVPKPEPGSFNKHRAVSKLLRAQMDHLLEALKKKLDAELRSIKTEGEASAYIKKITAILHPQGTKRPAK